MAPKLCLIAHAHNFSIIKVIQFSLSVIFKAPMAAHAIATGHFSWPHDATLCHLPPERELLSDRARRLVFETYLRLGGLPYTAKMALNADYMSPSGQSPFLRFSFGVHSLMFSDFDKLVTFLEAQHTGIGWDMEESDKADREAFVSLIRSKIIPAEEYQTWVTYKNLKEHTVRLHGYGLAWPLREVVPWVKRIRFCWDHWQLFRRPNDEVLLDFEQACAALSERLGNRETFFESGLSTLDVQVYGHIQAVLSTALPSGDLATILLKFENLQQFCRCHLPKRGLPVAEQDTVNVQIETT